MPSELPLAIKVLNLLTARECGLNAPEILRSIRPRISQSTLWRTLDALRAQGVSFREGQTRGARYHARARTDIAALRSLRMHECVARCLIRDPSLRARALERLAKLRLANPHGRRYHDRWYELLQGPLIENVRIMTESSERAEELRKESPLSVLITPRERERIFEATRAC